MIRKSFSHFLFSLFLSACALEETRQKITSDLKEAEGRFQRAENTAQRESSASLEITGKPWLGNKAVSLKNGHPLPPVYERPQAVSIRTALPQSLYQIAEFISHDLGIPPRVDNLVLSTSQKAEGFDPSQWTIPLVFEGTLSELLKRISANFDVSWRYDGQEIHLYRYETRTFVIESLPGVQSMVDGLSGSAIGGDKGSKAASSSGDATQKAEMSVNLEFWAELTKTLESLLAGEGRVTVSPSSGTVAVTALPSKMRIISRFLQEENRRLSKQAAITVEIWSVSLNDSDNYGTDLRAVFKERQGLTYALEGAKIFADDQAGSLGVTVLHPASRTKLHRFDGSKLAFEALSTVGKVTRKARIPVTVLNNRPATRKIAIDTAYLESVSTTMAQDGASQNALNPGVVSSGIILQLLPRILDDGRIILQYSLYLSELIGMQSFGSDEHRIQLPEQTKRLFVQQSSLRNGSTLILSGFEQDQFSLKSQGVGHAWNLLMGGVKGEHSREMIVIAITPHLLSSEETSEKGEL
jgi:type IVB pilus formation R64 PilN family outer membrane protein